MSYEEFCEGITNLVNRTEPGTKVRFCNEEEKGRFSAWLSSGMQVTMNEGGFNLSIKYGSGHHMRVPATQAFAVA